MDKCEHSKLYITDFANQPSPLGRCLFCELAESVSKLDAAQKEIAELCGPLKPGDPYLADIRARLRASESRLGTLESELESWQEMCRHAERNDHVHMDERDAALLRLDSCCAALMEIDIGCQIGDMERVRRAADKIAEAFKGSAVERVCARCGVGEIVVVEGQLRCTMCGLDYESRAVETPHE